MPEFQTSPGMRDILPPESARWRRFVHVFADVAERAGYGQVISPLLEDLGVFQRIGDATDVVTKEMYDFVDKGGRHIALRPELTASRVPGVRAAPAGHAVEGLVRRLAASGTRSPSVAAIASSTRSGIEVLGADDPYLDVEVIALGWEFYRALGLQQVNAAAQLASASPTTGPATSTRCEAYFRANLDELSRREPGHARQEPAAGARFQARPGRADRRRRAAHRRLLQRRGAAPTSRRCRPGLTALGIPFTIDATLVRGLDYYRHTTFEFQGGTLDSAQNAIGGGGRYDGLVEALGGPATPGIGFALGLDRTLLACDAEGVFAAPPTAVDVFVVDTTGGARGAADHRRAARGRHRRRPGVRQPQHEEPDEGRRPQRRRATPSSSAPTSSMPAPSSCAPCAADYDARHRTRGGQQAIDRRH